MSDDTLLALFAESQHRHAWTWSDDNTRLRAAPPPEVTCACGKTYAQVVAEPTE